MSCALKNHGQIWCWGTASTGLGDAAETERSPLPVRVDGISGARAVAAGEDFACAIRADRGAACWGYNGSGQLGDGTGNDSPTPVATTVPGDLRQLVTGREHACALREAGDVFCWGDNSYGQLGDGSRNDRETPVPVPGLTAVRDITAGTYHTCAALQNGTVKCWGSNEDGQIGLGNNNDDEIVDPTDVEGGLGDATAVAAGDEHTCALRRNGTVACWGEDGDGQTGTESAANPMLPTTIAGLNGVTAIAAGGYNSCALRERQVLCWGDNQDGALGSGFDGDQSFNPVPVAGLGATAGVTVGEGQICASTRGRPGSDVVRCWGFGDYGELGNGRFGTSQTPVPVDIAGVRSVAPGVEHNCALLEDQSVKCWGRNRYGQLGVPGSDLEASPVTVPGIKAELLASSRVNTCAVTPSVEGAGRKISCWGDNSYGQLGTGDLVSAPSPVDADLSGVLTEPNSRIVALAAGGGFTCALKQLGSAENGTVWCWGQSDRGQTAPGVANPPLRQPIPAEIDRPVPMSIKTDQKDGATVAAGFGHACSIAQQGRVWCWGLNSYGQVGDNSTGNTRNRPVVVPGITGAVQLALGTSHTCALLDAGTVKCWGQGNFGQLGDGAATDSTVPVDVRITDVTSITADQGQTCATTTDGRLHCWGPRFDQGFTDRASWSVPQPVTGASDAVSAAVAEGHGCYAGVDGKLRCWVGGGYYYRGLHGDGPMPAGHYPVQVEPTPVTGFEPPTRPAHPRIELRDGRLWLRSLPLKTKGAKPCPKRVRALMFQKVKVKSRRGKKKRKVRVIKRLKTTGGNPCLVSGAMKARGALRKVGKVRLKLTGNGLKPQNRQVKARHTVKVSGAKLRLDRFPVGSAWAEGCPEFARVIALGLGKPARGVKKIRAKAPVTFAPEAGCQVTDTFRLPKKLRRAARLRVTVTGPDLDPGRRQFRP